MTQRAKKTLTRKDLTQHLADRCWLHPVTAHKVVDLFCHQITAALAQDKTVTLRRFGTFKPKRRRSYKMRHSQGGQNLDVAVKKLTSFKVSKILLKALS